MRKLIAALIAVMLMIAVVPMTVLACDKAEDCTETATEITSNNNGTHTISCASCKAVIATEACSGGNPTCSTSATCSVCNGSYTVGHNYNVPTHDETQHWNKCQWCDEPDSKSDHTFIYALTTDGKCGVSCSCGYAASWEHDLKAGAPAQEATCQQIGWDDYEYCNRKCGYTTYVEIPKLKHNIPDKYEVPPTCVSDGRLHGTCTLCNEDITIETYPKNTHEAAEAWTSDETGHWHECVSACGHKFEQAGHTEITETITLKPATCTSGGTEREDKICSVCGYTIEEGQVTPTDPLGHKYSTERSHNNRIHYYECTNGCDLKSQPANHTWAGDWAPDPGNEATCTNPGSEGNTCTVCEAYIVRPCGPTTNHIYGDWLITETTHTRTCTTCPADNPNTQKGNHNWKTIKVYEGQEPTCFKEGKIDRQCTICDHIQYGVTVKLDHIPVPHAAKAPTCTEVGYPAYETCNCKDCPYSTYDKTKEKPALGHKLGDWYDTGNDTHRRDCQRVIPTAAKARAAASDGVRCSYYEEAPHTIDHGVIVKRPTYLRKGTVKYTCTTCGMYYYEYIARYSDNPRTGDYIMVAVTVMAVAAIGLTGVVVYGVKKKKK